LSTVILFLFNVNLIASIVYIHPGYGGIQTHNLFDVNLLPLPLDHGYFERIFGFSAKNGLFSTFDKPGNNIG